MLKKLDGIKKEVIHKNPYWEYWIDDYIYPDGRIGKYYYVNSRGAVMIVARNEDGKFLMTRQFRYLNSRESLEFPGGGVKPGVGYEKSALEELEEETFHTGKITKIGEYNPFNGVTNEITEIYFADNLSPKKASRDDSEEIEVIEITKEEIIHKIKTGEIWDGMTLAAWAVFVYSEFC